MKSNNGQPEERLSCDRYGVNVAVYKLAITDVCYLIFENGQERGHEPDIVSTVTTVGSGSRGAAASCSGSTSM